MKTTRLSRRTILASSGAAAVSSLLTGCLKAPPFRYACPAGPPPPHSDVPILTIDAHCHIFNGADLQIGDFLTKVEVQGKGNPGVAAAAAILKELEWTLAPSGDEELRVLKRMRRGTGMSPMTVKQHRDQAYVRARKAVNKVLDKNATAPAPATTRSRPAPLPPQGSSPGDVKNYMRKRMGHENWDAYRILKDQDSQSTPALAPPPPPRPIVRALGATAAAPAANTCPAEYTGRSVDGVLDLAIQYFHYRYVMIDDYLNAFTYSTGRCVDLMVVSMVDYDWWLAGGAATKTDLQTQVEVMEQISVLSRGQVHGLVPFDPFREVAYLAGHEKLSSMALVQEAIMQRGCIGVKLYPPMGFAPFGNEALDAMEFWKGKELPPWIDGTIPYKDKSTAPFGKRLDDVLRTFYQWCVDNDVPVMAHTAMTNGSADGFAALPGAQYWAKALLAFPMLRISFGHLGDFADNLNDDANLDANGFLRLMSSATNTFADSGYFSSILNEPTSDCLRDRLKRYYSKPLADGGVIADRLMYGTDWSLMITEGDIEQYFQDFIQAFDDIDKLPRAASKFTPSQRFFGYNAADWLSLRGGKTRARLNDFYKANKITLPPPWLQKVDMTPRETI